jgi:hypothetical protein
MQAVEVVCICCLCCIKVLQCSCKTRRARRISLPVFFAFSLLLIGALIWGISAIGDLREENSELVPEVTSCAVICGTEYQQKGGTGMCCWESANDCRSKEQCQSDWDDFYSTLSVSCKILISLAAMYCAFFLGYVTVKCLQKRRAALAPQPLLEPSFEDSLINPSDGESRLRESVVVQDSSLCSICLESYADSKAIELDCGHLYHSECIRIWVRKHTTCPLCRGAI